MDNFASTCFQANANNSCYDLLNQCSNCEDSAAIQAKLAEPMVWIGIYVAAASLVCSLAMAADVFQGFRQRKLWFPCKFFTLNSASLTLLAIATKLPVDLTVVMRSRDDQLTKLSGIAFTSIIIVNFIPSLARMDNKDMITNVVALDILVITILVNLCIQIQVGTGILDTLIVIALLAVMVLMFILLVLLSFWVLTIPTVKRVLQSKYAAMHKTALNEELGQSGKVTVLRLKNAVKKHWMMAETGSLQFVMGRSASCAASGALCFLIVLVLVAASFRRATREYGYVLNRNRQRIYPATSLSSDYKWSIIFIVLIQIIGVLVGTIAPTLRWLTVLRFKYSRKKSHSFRHELTVENYWIQRLREWKESPLALKIRHQRCRKLVHHTKNLILDLCICVQVLIVVASKMVVLVSFFITVPILSCSYLCKQLIKKLISKSRPESESNSALEMVELRRYVMLLEGEDDLPESVVNNISSAANSMIDKAKKQQPKNLLKLVEKSEGFKGVAEFDRGQVESLLPEEAPNSWSLPLVTLTSIAIALPKIKDDVAQQLIRSVNEGLIYTKLIETRLDSNEDSPSTRNAAGAVWFGIKLYRRWLDNDLRDFVHGKETPEENLKKLADIAKNNVMDFKRNMNGGLEGNLLNCPLKVVASNSMYRISQTVLARYQGSDDKTSEGLFEQLSCMIADILGACLTNLPHVITTKCFCSTIEKREDNVRQAARLLGETEEILKILLELELPRGMDPNKMASINEWCTLLKQETSTVVSSSATVTPSPGEVHIVVEQRPV